MMLASLALIASLLLPIPQSSSADEARVAGIAEARDLDALRQLEELVDSDDRGLSAAAAEAMWRFRDDPELSRRAIDFLYKRTGSRKEGVPYDAVHGLMKFRAAAYPELELVVRKNRNELVRAYALQTLTPLLLERGGADDLALLLDHCILARTAWRKDLIERVSTFDLALCLPVFEKRLKGGKLHPEIESVVFETLIGREPEGAQQVEELERVLALGLRDKLPMVQHAALRALRGRSAEPFAGQLARLSKSRDRSVQLAAMHALLEGGLPEEVFTDPMEAAAGQNPTLRWVSIEALRKLAIVSETSEALDQLHRLAGDPDRTVRLRARDALVKLHVRESIPVLIEQAKVEVGVELNGILEALRMLSGVDHGRAAARWVAWWEDVGESFEMPSRRGAQKAAKQRAAKRAEGETVASFYQQPIESHRLCFIVDLSGSMGYRAADGRARIAFAREQLTEAIESLPDGTRCNVILFSEDADRWARLAQELNERSRKKLIDFVLKRDPDGGTNLYAALELAFEDPDIDTFYILTDGVPSAGTTSKQNPILAEVERWNLMQRATLHTISIGEDSSLLEALSAASGGTYTRAD